MSKQLSAVKKLQEGFQKGAMDPSGIFYDAGSGHYLVDVGEHYRDYSRKSPVTTGVQWHFENLGLKEEDAIINARREISRLEVRQAVDWSGPLAGHSRGPLKHPTGSLLVTSEPALPVPKHGKFPVIEDIIRQLLVLTPEQVDVFLGWLSGAFRAVQAGVHQPAPLLAVAGPVNCGKSLLAWIVAKVLGGRVGHPHAAWSGSMIWNDDLVGSELLLVDDSVGSTDYRARQAFAARFKEAIFGPEIQLRKRHRTSVSVRPVWRVMACCNDTPEALEVLPPISADMADKMILLSAAPVSLQIDTSSPEGKKELQKQILSELPALASRLKNLEIPDHLHDSRGGVTAWRHPELVAALEGISPAQQLRELIALAFERGSLDTPWLDTVELTAAELESTLTAPQSQTATQARTLLRGARQAGRYLSELSKANGGLVERLPLRQGVQYWRIRNPHSDRPPEDSTPIL